MNRKEVIRHVLAGKTPPVTPYLIEPTRNGKKKLAQYYDIDINALESFMGNHLLYLNYSPPNDFIPEKLEKGLIKDEFGVTWDIERFNAIGDWGMVDHPVKDMSLDTYAFPKVGGKGRFDETEKIVARNPDKFNLLQMLGIFEIPNRFAGMEDVMVGMAISEDFANKSFDLALEFNLGILSQLPYYVEGVRFIEDWGDQRGLMMGINYWRKYLKPRLKIMYEACKKSGRAVFIHSCGNITEVIPDLIELGVDVIDPIQPEVMDLRFIKKEYGKNIVFFGGVGSQSTIPLGTPEQVVEEAKRLLGFMAEDGKYILGPSGAISTEAPVENVAALIEFCKEMTG